LHFLAPSTTQQHLIDLIVPSTQTATIGGMPYDILAIEATHRIAVRLAHASLLVALLSLSGCQKSMPQEPWQVHGAVVDESGQPVEDFVAATLWSSNGPTWYDNGLWHNENGNVKKYESSADLAEIWKDEGVLEAFPSCLALHTSGNAFTST